MLKLVMQVETNLFKPDVEFWQVRVGISFLEILNQSWELGLKVIAALACLDIGWWDWVADVKEKDVNFELELSIHSTFWVVVNLYVLTVSHMR